jgi:hypothetical protein
MATICLLSCKESAKDKDLLFLDGNPRSYKVQLLKMSKDSIFHLDSLVLERIVNQSDTVIDVRFVFSSDHTEKYIYVRNTDSLILKSVADVFGEEIEESEFMYLCSKRYEVNGYSHRIYKYVIDFGTIDGSSVLFYSDRCGTILRVYPYPIRGVTYLYSNDLACGGSLLQALLSDKQYLFEEGLPAPPPPPPMDWN